MRLNLHLLRVFHAVATEGSFSAAARSLHISQPAVSKAVAELERQLDMALIERNGARVGQGPMLTEAGAALNAHARGIFALEHAAVEELQQRSGLKRGQLVVGASTTIASYWLPRYLHAFSQEWPEIVLKVVVGNTHAIAEDLLDCHLDLALVEGPVHVEGVAYHPWREERLVLVAPKEFDPRPFTEAQDGLASGEPSGQQASTDEDTAGPVLWMSTEELSRCTWLVREAGSGTREVSSELLAKRGVRPSRTIEIGSNEGIARAVAAGLGVAMLPYAVVEDLLLLQRVVELRVPQVARLSRVLYRVERRDRPPSPAVGAFLNILTKEAAVLT
jgi:Transcriptional regulator